MYEQKLNEIDIMLESKTNLSNELQNEVNILQILLKQEQTENQKKETEASQSRVREEELHEMIRHLELQVKEVTNRYEEFSREFEKAENKIHEV